MAFHETAPTCQQQFLLQTRLRFNPGFHTHSDEPITAGFHETAPTCQQQFLLQTRLRFNPGFHTHSDEPITAGSMQVRFRVEARRCHLSHELEAPDHRRSRQEIGLSQHYLHQTFTPFQTCTSRQTSHYRRKGFEAFPGHPHPMQQDRQFPRHRNHGPLLARPRAAVRQAPLT
jgi:hypothetical protein